MCTRLIAKFNFRNNIIINSNKNYKCYSTIPKVYGGNESVVSGNSHTTSNSKTSIQTIRNKYQKGTPLVVITAYDFPTAQIVEESGADMLLVGDSLAMVCLGLNNTRELTMDEMVHHCKAASRGASKPFLIGDLPFGSYEASNELAIKSAVRLLSEGRMDAVKLEGGVRMVDKVSSIVRAGIPVMGHIGLTPQSSSSLGGYVSQGKTANRAVDILNDALALQDAGCFSIVLESIPDRVAEVITKKLSIPTIGIGAGNNTSGQVLVFHDMLGLFSGFSPKFCKKFGNLREPMKNALVDFKEEVISRKFPAAEHSFTIKDSEFNQFLQLIENNSTGKEKK